MIHFFRPFKTLANDAAKLDATTAYEHLGPSGTLLLSSSQAPASHTPTNPQRQLILIFFRSPPSSMKFEAPVLVLIPHGYTPFTQVPVANDTLFRA